MNHATNHTEHEPDRPERHHDGLEPRIYVASLSDYNAGRLHGTWIHADDDPDDIDYPFYVTAHEVAHQWWAHQVIGADVQGDSAEAKLARAEAAVEAGDLGKAVELVKSMPPQTARATAGWLSRAEDYLAAKRAIDQLAAQAVALLGATR